jgi:hypothetical protein
VLVSTTGKKWCWFYRYFSYWSYSSYIL